MSPIWKHIITALCALLIIAYMVFGILMSRSMMPQSVCQHLQVHIVDQSERQYVSSMEITQLVQSKGLYPVGKTSSSISLQAIEDVVRGHSMVRSAECYRTIDGDIAVRLTQRVPLLRVVSDAETYFIDTDLKLMPVRESVNTSVLVVTGHVSKRMAIEQASQLALWLHQNKYWSSYIARVEVHNPKMIHIIQNSGRAEIILGDWQGFDRKLNKLQHWYEADSLLHQEQYPQVDVRFYGQVIGIKPD